MTNKEIVDKTVEFCLRNTKLYYTKDSIFFSNKGLPLDKDFFMEIVPKTIDSYPEFEKEIEIWKHFANQDVLNEQESK